MERAYDHADFRGHLDAYLAGGLPGAEREAFERHAAGCAACAALLADAAAQDESLRQLFADARPPADLEDRLVERLRGARQHRPMIHPMVRGAATGVAAAVLLAGFGYLANQAMEKGGLPTPWASEARKEVAIARAPAYLGARFQQAEGKQQQTTAAYFLSPTEMADTFNKELKQQVAGEWSFGEAPAQKLAKQTEASRGDSYPGMGGPLNAPGMAGPMNAPASEPAKEGKRSLDEKKVADTNGVVAGDSR